MALQFKYFVGGFTPQTTQNDLIAAFSPYGTVVEAYCVARNGVNRGFGFVTFAQLPDPTILSGGIEVNGNVVTVQEAVTEGEAAAGALGPGGRAEKWKYFIGGLPTHCTNADLQAVFQEFGPLKDAKVITSVSGKNRGFGFVCYNNVPSDAFFNSSIEVLGRQVTVKESIPQDELQTRKIFVGGLAGEMTEDHLFTIFEPFGPIEEVQVIRDKSTGQSRGFGFVTFATDDACANAIHYAPRRIPEMGVSLTVRQVESKLSLDGRSSTPGAPAFPNYSLGSGSRGRGAKGGPGGEWSLRQRLAEEQQRRMELEERLAMYEGSWGGSGGRWNQGWSKPKATKYQPY